MPNPKEKTLDWREEFDRLTSPPENYEQAKNSLYWEESYPESKYELDAEKIKAFIVQVEQSAYDRCIGELKEKIETHEHSAGCGTVCRGLVEVAEALKRSKRN
uniref:Uncharacterized protein n=1 Tax=viral metagenome TaxID=1070528 RepID=A0A6M3J8X2_9ZZZZ